LKASIAIPILLFSFKGKFTIELAYRSEIIKDWCFR